MPQTLLGMGSAALAAAVALPRTGHPNFSQGINAVIRWRKKVTNETFLK